MADDTFKEVAGEFESGVDYGCALEEMSVRESSAVMEEVTSAIERAIRLAVEVTFAPKVPDEITLKEIAAEILARLRNHSHRES